MCHISDMANEVGISFGSMHFDMGYQYGIDCHRILALFFDWWVKAELCLYVLGSPEKLLRDSQFLSEVIINDEVWVYG